jgi:hypothetical protein
MSRGVEDPAEAAFLQRELELGQAKRENQSGQFAV